MQEEKANKTPVSYFSLPGLKYSDKKVSSQRILAVVCKEYNFKKEELFSKDQNKDLVRARQILCYLLKVKCTEKLTSKDIAKIIGYVNYTTVIFSYTKITNQIKYNLSTRKEIDNLIIKYLL